MNTDLKNCFKTYTGDGVKFVPVYSLDGIELSKDSHYCSGDDVYVPINNNPSISFKFKFKNKNWYRIRKLLGMYKPIYKRKKKGKRYVLYEVV